MRKPTLHKLKGKGRYTLYYYSTAIEKQSAVLGFFINFEEQDRAVWSIALGVGKNRKQVLSWMDGESEVIDRRETGKDLFATFIWAKNLLPEVERQIKQLTRPDKKAFIWVTGADGKRTRVYRRVLPKFGYELKETEFLKKVLEKEII